MANKTGFRTCYFALLFLGGLGISAYAQINSGGQEGKMPIAGSTDSSWYYLNGDGSAVVLSPISLRGNRSVPGSVDDGYFKKYLIVFEAFVSDQEKLEKARVELGHFKAMNMWFSSWQIKKLAQKFNSEVSRLEFAKEAYPFCLDAEYYRQVNEVFPSKATREELNKFISEQKK